MSGPKTGHYTLTPEQRRRLEEQLRKAREEQIRREKLDAAKKLLKKMLVKGTEFVSEIAAIPDAGEQMVKAADKLTAVMKECEKAQAADRIANVQEASRKLAAASDELQLCLAAYLNERYEKKRAQSEAEDRLIAKGFSVTFRKIEDKQKLAKDSYYKKIQDALGSLSGVHLTAHSATELDRIRQLAGNIDSIDFLENFYAVTVYPFVRECNEYYAKYIKFNDEYMELHAEYKVLMSERGELPDPEFEEFSMKQLDKLKDAVKRMQMDDLEQQEEEYISAAIDDAMQEMGYALVGTRNIIRKSGKKTHKELYHFSDGTVVDVTYSSTGQISMELGAVDTVDRVPSYEESQKLTEDMEKFCGEYAAMEKILKKKGVVRRNIQILPPSQEYAQVINIEDYDMKQTIDRYSVEKKGHAGQAAKYMNL